MSSLPTTFIAAKERSHWMGRLADYFELTKPRIVAMELITIAMGFYLATVATGNNWSLSQLLATLLGTGLVAASASSLNQWIEMHLDALMVRTADRPLPAKRLQPWQALTFGLVLLVAGATWLLWGAGWLPFAWGVACWVVYVVIYTPLKTQSTLNTAVGAVSGAMPIIIGWVAAGGSLNAVSVGLFGVLYLWQYPHFMAIAWRCRDDYLSARYVMSTTVDPTGRRAGIEAITSGLLLAPVSLLPVSMASNTTAGTIYIAWTLVLAVIYLRSSIAFAREPNDATSRKLLLISLLYLPCWILGLFLIAI